MDKRDYYTVLEVSKTASSDEIKKAYRKAAMKYHPDRNPDDKNAEEKFKEATEAYQVLSDSNNRQKYDQFGHAAFDQQSGFGGFGDFSGFEDIFGDLFSSFFGTSFGGGGSRGRAGRDLRYSLEVEFKEAIFGVEKEITVTRNVFCEDCDGSGAAPGSAPESCGQCGGRGQITIQQGFFSIARTCHICNGAGKVIKDKCQSCHGTGQEPKDAKIKAKIPAGIDSGQRLKLRGEGEAGTAGGPAGDLYIEVNIKPHEIFERQDSELLCVVPITYPLAVLGAEIEVPTLEGKAKMKIPAGTPSGKIFRMRGKGVPIIGTNRRGDQHVQIIVNVPKKVSQEHKKVLEQLKEHESIEKISNTQGFFDKMREMFS